MNTMRGHKFFHLGKGYVGSDRRKYFYCVELDVDDPERPLSLWYGVKHEDDTEEGKAGNYYSFSDCVGAQQWIKHLHDAGCDWNLHIISNQEASHANIIKTLVEKYTSIHGEPPGVTYSLAKGVSRSSIPEKKKPWYKLW